MENMYPLIWVVFIICVFLTWFFSHRAKHKERLMKIEKGFDPDVNSNDRKISRLLWLKFGIIVLGLSVGLLIIALLARFRLLDEWGPAMPLAILGACIGISMIIFNFINRGENK